MSKLEDAAINDWIASHDGWARDGDMITRTFEFDSFPGAIEFVNRVAEDAEDLNHHPDIDIRYSTITVAMTTHDAGGLTHKDLELAERVDVAAGG